MGRLTSGRGLLRFTLVGLLLWLGPGIDAAEKAKPEPLRLSAFAVDLSGTGRVQAEQLQIVIERWSTDTEHEKLLGVLRETGSEKLLDTIQTMKPRAGHIRTTTSLGWDIQYARESSLPEGGRRIVFVTDRPMSFYERANRTRSSEYEYMFCEIHLGKDGTGEGKLSVPARISYDNFRKVLEVEDYGTEPVRLTRVEVRE